MNKPEITELILTSLQSIIDADENIDSNIVLNPETKLIGDSAVVESIGLVNLIADVEEVLDDDHDVVITIADERAMSREKSPFIDVDALAEYVLELIEETNNG